MSPEQLLADVKAERAKPQADRRSGAIDAQLDLVIAALERAIADGDAAVAGEVPEINRIVVDGWNWRDPLAERVLAWTDRVRG